MHYAHENYPSDIKSGYCLGTDQQCSEVGNIAPVSDVPFIDNPYAGMSDLERIEAKIDKMAAAIDDIVKVVSNVVDGLDNNPMMKAMSKMFGKGN